MKKQNGKFINVVGKKIKLNRFSNECHLGIFIENTEKRAYGKIWAYFQN